ncbi:response regulator [Cellvibrio sp. ARAG 10.3]|uniref:response regulator transcription factor n=1 Tax=Cellvibrio sp. ARAG 10.3 TaxID=3451358 RepID=UPI003F462E91
MAELLAGEKVLIAEDHELYRDGLKLLFEEINPETRIYLAGNFPEALTILLREPDITLVMLDIRMPGTQDLDGLKEIRSRFPTLIIIVVSTLDFDTSTRQMIDAGANGFIAKSTPKQSMKRAIAEVLDGNIVIESEREGTDFIDLSQQQLATLRYLAEGLSNKEIASRLGVSPLTAKEYVSKVIERLDAANRTQAVLIAQKHGLLIDHLM